MDAGVTGGGGPAGGGGGGAGLGPGGGGGGGANDGPAAAEPIPGSTRTTLSSRAAAALGSVGQTTVAGNDAYTSSISFPIGTTIGMHFFCTQLK